jgi:hypothetical protein
METMKRERGQRAPFQTVGSRYPPEVAEKITADAERLGLNLSEWMRMAAARMLKQKVSPEAAAAFRMVTKEEEREARREAKASA